MMKPMKDDLISKLKRMVSEPKIFSLLVSSARGQILYMGVHFSLEEAYTSARKKMESFTEHRKGESIEIDLWNTIPARQAIAQIVEPIHLDSVFPAPAEATASDTTNKSGHLPLPEDQIQSPVQMVKELLNLEDILDKDRIKGGGQTPSEKKYTASEQVRDVRKSKNDLMKKLIVDGDLDQVDKAKDVLGTSSVRYVKNAIAKKKEIINNEEEKDNL